MASNSSAVSAAVHHARRSCLGQHAGVQDHLNDGVDIVGERRHRRNALTQRRSSRSRVGRKDDPSWPTECAANWQAILSKAQGYSGRVTGDGAHSSSSACDGFGLRIFRLSVPSPLPLGLSSWSAPVASVCSKSRSSFLRPSASPWEHKVLHQFEFRLTSGGLGGGSNFGRAKSIPGR